MADEEKRIENLCTEIITQAEQEANEIIREAEKQKAEILAKAQKEAVQEKEEYLEDKEKAVRERKEQKLASINLEARRKILNKKEALIQQIFEQAREELAKLSKKAGYKKILNQLIIEAGVGIGGGDLVITARKKDHTKIDDLKSLAKKIASKCGNKCNLTLSKKDLQSIGGVVVGTKDGSITITNTFEDRLNDNFDAIRSNIAEILFPK
ncbi:MAG: V-type ATP synthase subunit E family protein [Asgard group archaeon]|nr:V-type ATP synthase subunit E family protein [Asgard group archaeon]